MDDRQRAEARQPGLVTARRAPWHRAHVLTPGQLDQLLDGVTLDGSSDGEPTSVREGRDCIVLTEGKVGRAASGVGPDGAEGQDWRKASAGAFGGAAKVEARPCGPPTSRLTLESGRAEVAELHVLFETIRWSA